MDSPDSSSGSLVGGIVGAILAILIVAVVLVLWYMMERRDREREKYGEHKRQNKIYRRKEDLFTDIAMQLKIYPLS